MVLTGSDNMWTVKIYIFYFKSTNCMEQYSRVLLLVLTNIHLDILKSPGMNLPTTIFNYLYVQIIGLSRSWISSWIIFIVLDFLHSPEFFWLFVKIFFFSFYIFRPKKGQNGLFMLWPSTSRNSERRRVQRWF